MVEDLSLLFLQSGANQGEDYGFIWYLYAGTKASRLSPRRGGIIFNRKIKIFTLGVLQSRNEYPVTALATKRYPVNRGFLPNKQTEINIEILTRVQSCQEERVAKHDKSLE